MGRQVILKVLLALSLSFQGNSNIPEKPTEVIYLGDSLAQETSQILSYLVYPKKLVPKFFGGTAPCDWLDDDLEVGRNSVVVIQFTGNSITPCMKSGESYLNDQALVEKYDHDIGVLIRKIRADGGRIVLVGQPYRAPSYNADEEVAGINKVYQRYAKNLPYVSFIDAGASVELNGEYSRSLSCNQFDIDCKGGKTVVRGDGAHFCPVAGKNPCPVYSSGAFRYGMAIAGATNNPTKYD